MSRSFIARLRALASESGTTLVELLMTVIILGIAFTAIVGGMTSAVLGSDIHRKQSTSEALLRSYAETLKASDYVVCATTSTTSYTGPAGLTVAAGFQVSMSAPEYWNSGTSAFQSTCPSPDAGAQRITLTAFSTDGRASQSVTIVKRKP